MPTTESPRSPWTVMEEFSKTVVTVSSALLGVTVTFSSQLIGKIDEDSKCILFIAWGASVVAIALGVAAHMFVIRYLTTGGTSSKWWCGLCGNGSFIFLIVAAIAFAILGGSVVNNHPTIGAAEIAETAIQQMPRISGNKNSNWIIQSLLFNTTDNTYDLILIELTNKDQYDLTLTANANISKVSKK